MKVVYELDTSNLGDVALLTAIQNTVVYTSELIAKDRAEKAAAKAEKAAEKGEGEVVWTTETAEPKPEPKPDILDPEPLPEPEFPEALKPSEPAKPAKAPEPLPAPPKPSKPVEKMEYAELLNHIRNTSKKELSAKHARFLATSYKVKTGNINKAKTCARKALIACQASRFEDLRDIQVFATEFAKAAGDPNDLDI
jgi:outer membrane biosynthesis protein TonB